MEQAIGELKESNDQLAQEIEEKERIDNMRQEFIVNVSHELKTPLAIMQAKLEMFAEEHPDADSEITDLLRFQTDQVSRLASLVRTLLEMSDLQSIPREDHIELAPLADEIVADLTPLAQRRSITLFQECEDVSIKGSDTLIYRLLFNLVENGIKYNTPGGSVHITIRQKKSSAVLRVADTGCGIPEEYRTSMFQPFFRVDKSRSREMGGVGLGLALVREIALLHGGTVTAEPADGHGTVFTVTLPIQA